jgi:sugar transferase EpsL
VTTKRAFDLGLVFLASPVWIPFFIFVSVAVRFALGSPIFFTQQRPGLGGKCFKILKFRTMRDIRTSDGHLLPDHQRTTAFGRWLRSTSLDELPELINIVRGEMSLVGPRPLLPQYLELYTASQRRRHEVLPGLTGWAQINGRNATSWEQRFELDLWYINHKCLWLDINILGRTVLSVVQR